MSDTRFICNRDIYEEVIQREIPSAKAFVWIATADIKDLHVHQGR